MKTIVYVFGMDFEEKKQYVDKVLEKIRRPDLKTSLHAFEREFPPPYGKKRFAEYRFFFEEGDATLDTLIEELHENVHLSVRMDRVYTRQELLAAELLHLMITGTVGEGRDHYGTRFDWSQACRGCWSGLVQTGDLIIDKAKMGKKDIAKTYTSEVVISERLTQLIQEAQLKGYELRPVRHRSNRLRDEPILYQLIVTHTLPPVAPSTQVRTCSDCGRSGLELFTEIYYRRQDLEKTGVKDFNQTMEWYHWIIVSQKVYRLFLEHKIRNFEVEVVRILD